MSVRKNVWADIQQRYVYTKTKTQSSKTKEAAPSAELLLLDGHLPTFRITLWAARDVASVVSAIWHYKKWSQVSRTGYCKEVPRMPRKIIS